MNDTPTTAQQQTTIPTSPGHDFADTWCGTLTAHIAPLLNCEEVDVLTSLLRTLGAEHAADAWIDAHSLADNEPTDNHYRDPHAPETPSADAFHWYPGPEGT